MSFRRFFETAEPLMMLKFLIYGWMVRALPFGMPIIIFYNLVINQYNFYNLILRIIAANEWSTVIQLVTLTLCN